MTDAKHPPPEFADCHAVVSCRLLFPLSVGETGAINFHESSYADSAVAGDVSPEDAFVAEAVQRIAGVVGTDFDVRHGNHVTVDVDAQCDANDVATDVWKVIHAFLQHAEECHV